jgi:CO/xanthine dehydrogenase FAD-binding subunit
VRPPPFAHVAPRSVDEALAHLAEHGDEAKVLAGGQSLLPLMALRLARPAVLVDVTRVPGLDAVGVDPDGWLRIGATARQRAVERSALVAGHLPVLVEAVRHIAHVPIRTQGTVGGSLCHADPAAELPLVAVAIGAELVIAGPGGERVVPAVDFFRGFLETALGPDELLTAVRFPVVTERTAFAELARREGDFAVAAVLAVGGRVWATGAGTVPRELPPDLDDLDLADDLHGTATWRRRVLERLRASVLA